jgi:hypothetical protein
MAITLTQSELTAVEKIFLISITGCRTVNNRSWLEWLQGTEMYPESLLPKFTGKKTVVTN